MVSSLLATQKFVVQVANPARVGIVGDGVQGRARQIKIQRVLFAQQNDGISLQVIDANLASLKVAYRLSQTILPIFAVGNINKQRSDEEGIWYLAHLEREYKNGNASSEEDKRTIDAEHYKIETVIDSGEKLTATAELDFTGIVEGERVLHFGLLPALRVTRVSFGDREVNFIQEKEKEIVVVCHGWSDGLAIPLTSGGSHLGGAQRQQIFPLSADRSFDDGLIKSPIISVADVAAQAHLSEQQITNLRAKMNQVRGLNLKHVAFRACNMAAGYAGSAEPR